MHRSDKGELGYVRENVACMYKTKTEAEQVYYVQVVIIVLGRGHQC